MPPSNKGIIQYINRLTGREAHDLQWIASSVGRSRALFKLTARKASRPPDADKKQWSKKSEKITRIAIISHPSPFENKDHSDDGVSNSIRRQLHPGAKLGLYNFDHYDLCLRHKAVKFEELRAHCSNLLREYDRLARQSDVIVSNELAFPSFWPGLPVWQNAAEDGEAADQRSGRPEYVDRTHIRLLRRWFEKELQKIAKEHCTIIMPGTFHDWNSFENVLPIKFPSHEDATDHVKRTTARRAKEFVKVSRLKELPVYNFGEFRFSVLICSDVYDLNIFFRQFSRSGRREEQPDIYFVPSFQPSRKSAHLRPADRDNQILRACEDLSWATGAAVVFVNQADARSAITRAIFFPGEPEPAYKDVGAGSKVFSFNWRRFHQANQKWRESQSSTMRVFTSEIRMRGSPIETEVSDVETGA
jgi:predicted amidohydrolase